jgi:hypothetical protein
LALIGAGFGNVVGRPVIGAALGIALPLLFAFAMRAILNP